MTSVISRWIWLGLSLITADESPPSPPPQQTLRVFADLKHTGVLTGPLTSSPAENEFGIAVPLAAVKTGRDRWTDTLHAADPVATGRGQFRVEKSKAAEEPRGRI